MGLIRHTDSVYGTSIDGSPIKVWLPDEGKPEILILGSVHGDEAASPYKLKDRHSPVLIDLMTGSVDF